jgi:hypothetical protein
MLYGISMGLFTLEIGKQACPVKEKRMVLASNTFPTNITTWVTSKMV